MPFLVRIQAVQRISEYKGTNSTSGEPYCIGSWKVKNVADNTIMLVSCFTKDDDILKKHPDLAMDAKLTITCRDWSKDGKSGTMNNVNLSDIIVPEGHEELPPSDTVAQVNPPSFVGPFGSTGTGEGSDLPF